VRSSSPSTSDRDPEEIAAILATISTALLVVFVVVVISASIPPRLLNPAWQLRFASSLVNNGALAMLGFVLIWLAAYINPSSGRLRARRDKIASLAAAAAIGYLLLIPLQSFAAWKGVSTANTSQSQQLRAANRRIVQLREAIKGARTTAEMQSRLQTLRVPNLPQAELSKPIEAVRPQILAGLDAAQARLNQQLQGLPPDRLWQLVQESIRLAISSLAYAFAFAAGAFLPGHESSLLQAWTGWFRRSLRHGPVLQSSGRRSNAAHADYLRELSRDEKEEED
jgi:hypothetical protein